MKIINRSPANALRKTWMVRSGASEDDGPNAVHWPPLHRVRHAHASTGIVDPRFSMKMPHLIASWCETFGAAIR
eukprot:502494-Amphidinium_carterae.1